MFDVELGGGESYRESAAFRPGDARGAGRGGGGRLGLTVCYDLRFPHLFRDLARAGAEILAVPAAFTVPTGRAHWHTLLRARAIETGAFVLAPAQSGTHAASAGAPRRTFGHSLAVSPWGEVLADAGEATGVTLVEPRPRRGGAGAGDDPRARPRPPLRCARPRRDASPPRDPLVIAFFSEIVMIEQLARNRLTRALPRGMELSHFMVLNHFARLGGEKTPAQLARTFHVTKGAMTNTLRRLDAAGYVHIRPDWDDARRKWVSLSPAGQARARPGGAGDRAGVRRRARPRRGHRLRGALPVLRAIRGVLGTESPESGG